MSTVNITIRIEDLIRDCHIHTAKMMGASDEVKKTVTSALLAAVNNVETALTPYYSFRLFGFEVKIFRK